MLSKMFDFYTFMRKTLSEMVYEKSFTTVWQQLY
jgi:hypothetical protein